MMRFKNVETPPFPPAFACIPLRSTPIDREPKLKAHFEHTLLRHFK